MPPDIAENLGASILTADGGAGVRRLVAKAGTTQVHERMKRFVEEDEPLSTAEYTALLERMDGYRSRMLSFMENYDAILCPVRPWPALRHGETITPEASPANLYTSVFNTTGWPGAVVRVGTGGCTVRGGKIAVGRHSAHQCAGDVPSVAGQMSRWQLQDQQCGAGVGARWLLKTQPLE